MLTKRALEFLMVLAVLPAVIPLGLLLAMLVWLDSPGPVLFVQTRPGKHGKPFRMLKFRTMIHLPRQTFRLTEKDDHRLTRAGKILRKLHLDEIPQLWHVLRGEMSLIGPRPVPMELYETYCSAIPDYERRHEVAPGITGLAQVMLGYVNTLEGEREKWALDMWYIRYRNGRLDGQILWATLAKVTGMAYRINHFPEKQAPPEIREAPN